MKNKYRCLIGLVVLTLAGCGEQPKAEVVETKQPDKIQISDNNIYSVQVKALNDAKAVEKLLLETSKKRLQGIDGLD